MTEREYWQCPECGWTGERTELDGTGSNRRCPVCEESVEFVD